jgi:hypothetical protein
LETSLSGTGVDGSDGLDRLLELFPLPFPVSLTWFSNVVDGYGGFHIRDARKRTVRWCARVARELSVRKKRYCTGIGAVEKGVVAREEDFSIRAQVR